MNLEWYSSGLVAYNVTEIFNSEGALQVPSTFVINPNPGYSISASMFSVAASTSTSIYSSVTFTNLGTPGDPSNTVLGTITYNSGYVVPASSVTETIDVIMEEIEDVVVLTNQSVTMFVSVEQKTGVTSTLHSSMSEVSIELLEDDEDFGDSTYDIYKLTFSIESSGDIEDVYLDNDLFTVTYEADQGFVIPSAASSFTLSSGEYDSLAFTTTTTFPDVELPSNIISLGTNTTKVLYNFRISEFESGYADPSLGTLNIPTNDAISLSCDFDYANATTIVQNSGQSNFEIPILQSTINGTTFIPIVVLGGEAGMLSSSTTSDTINSVYVDVSSYAGATNISGTVSLTSFAGQSPVLATFTIQQLPQALAEISFSSSEYNYQPPNSVANEITVPSSAQLTPDAVGFYTFTNYDVYNEAGDAFTGSSLISLLNDDNTAYTDNWFALGSNTVWSATTTAPEFYKTFHTFTLQENETTSDRIVKIKFEHGSDSSENNTIKITQKAAYDSSVDTVQYGLSVDGGATITDLTGSQGEAFAPSGESQYELTDEAQTLSLYFVNNDMDANGLNRFEFNTDGGVTGGWTGVTSNIGSGSFEYFDLPFGPDVDSLSYHPVWYEQESIFPSNSSGTAPYNKKLNITIEGRSTEESYPNQFRRVQIRHKHPENPQVNTVGWNKIKISQDKLTELNAFGPTGSELVTSIPFNANAFEFIHLDVFPDQQPVFRYINESNEVQNAGAFPSWVSSVGSYQATEAGELGNRKLKVQSTAQPNDIAQDEFKMGFWPSGATGLTYDNAADIITVKRNAAPADPANYVVELMYLSDQADGTGSFFSFYNYSTDGVQTVFDLGFLGSFTNKNMKAQVRVANWTIAKYNDSSLVGLNAFLGLAQGIQGATVTQLDPISDYINITSVQKNDAWVIDSTLPTHIVDFTISQTFEDQVGSYNILFQHGDYFAIEGGSNLAISLSTPATAQGQITDIPEDLVIDNESVQLPQNRVLSFTSPNGENKIVFAKLAGGDGNLSFQQYLPVDSGSGSFFPQETYRYWDRREFWKFDSDYSEDVNYNYTINQYFGFNADLSANGTSKIIQPDGPGTQRLNAALVTESFNPSSVGNALATALDTKVVYHRSKRFAHFGTIAIYNASEPSFTSTGFTPSVYRSHVSINTENQYLSFQYKLYHLDSNGAFPAYKNINANTAWDQDGETTALTDDNYWNYYGSENAIAPIGVVPGLHPHFNAVSFVKRNFRVMSDDELSSSPIDSVAWLTLNETTGSAHPLNLVEFGYWSSSPTFEVDNNIPGSGESTSPRSVKIGIFYDFEYSASKTALVQKVNSYNLNSDFSFTSPGSSITLESTIPSGADYYYYSHGKQGVSGFGGGIDGSNVGTIALTSLGSHYLAQAGGTEPGVGSRRFYHDAANYKFTRYPGDVLDMQADFVTFKPSLEVKRIKPGEHVTVDFDVIFENDEFEHIQVHALKEGESPHENPNVHFDIVNTNGYIYRTPNHVAGEGQSYPMVMCNRLYFENTTSDVRHLVFTGYSQNITANTSARLITSQNSISPAPTNAFELSKIEMFRNSIEELAPDHIVEITQEGLE